MDGIGKEVGGNYEGLELGRKYWVVVMGGYLGWKKVVEKWGKIGDEKKVMI